MFDLTAEPKMQRSQGRARVGFAVAGGVARLVELQQSGSGKAMLPRVAGPVPEVVFLNTSGGLTGGDRLDFVLEIAAGGRVSATTQTAERAYASTGGMAEVRVRATVGAGGRLDWLPQEAILYEASRLDRRTEIDLAGDATCLMSEAVVLGRQAMGEEPRDAKLHDRRVIRRDGRPVWAESVMLDAQALRRQSSPALLGGARAMAVLALVARGAEDALAALRVVLDEPGCTAAATGWDGRLLLRVLARDGWPLRRQMARAIRVLSGRPLPRVWQMQGENG
ncbi:urease accessory protein UreD [Paracoccaceae bacterium]